MKTWIVYFTFFNQPMSDVAVGDTVLDALNDFREMMHGKGYDDFIYRITGCQCIYGGDEE